MGTGAALVLAVCMGGQDAGAAAGSRIQRTMTLLATSTAQRRLPVRILFYGQSIVRQDYARKAVEADLRRRFPHADLTVENRAIGGYTAPALIRTAEQDLYPFYPDLVVFHVYGGERGGQFEGILRNIRERTTAEILTWTHHPDRRGIDHPGHERACKLRRELAEKYKCEMVDLREIWKQRLRDNNKKVDDFLTDVVHLNKAGGKLMGEILVRALQHHPNAPCTWADAVKTLPVADAMDKKVGPVALEGDWRRSGGGVVGTRGTLTVKFHGNRVDVTALPVADKPGTARILVDGRPPSAHPKAYAATLPTRTPIDYRPAVKQVGLGDDPKVETWTLTARDISADGKQFAFDLAGSVTGPDGSGTHKGVFVSSSKRITLRPRDFSFAEAIRIRKKPQPERFDVTWRVYLMGADVWTPKAAVEPGKVDRCTLIQGIANAEHTLEITPVGDGPVAIESITVHRPPGAPATKASVRPGAVRCEGWCPYHLQGICTDPSGAIYWSFTNVLVKTDAQGKRLRQVDVASHHGDLCYHDGKLYVAVNLGKFNQPGRLADSWVYVYDATDLSELARRRTPEVVHGAGAIACCDGRLMVAGGLPEGVQENYVYEYDLSLAPVKRHVIPSGYTRLGIQTAACSGGSCWFGCYGGVLLKTDAALRLKGKYKFGCSLGVVGLPDGRFLVAQGIRDQDKGCSGRVRVAHADDMQSRPVVSRTP